MTPPIPSARFSYSWYNNDDNDNNNGNDYVSETASLPNERLSLCGNRLADRLNRHIRG